MFPVTRYLEESSSGNKRKLDNLAELKARALQRKRLKEEQKKQQEEEEEKEQTEIEKEEKEKEDVKTEEVKEKEDESDEGVESSSSEEEETAAPAVQENYDPMQALKSHIKEQTAFQILGDDFEAKGKSKVRRVLPRWLSHPTVIHDISEAESGNTYDKLSGFMKENLKQMGIDKLFPVQDKVIPKIMEGFTSFGIDDFAVNDLCVSAATGSGKTLAFAIPIVEGLVIEDRVEPVTRALVMLPTKELAAQVYHVISSLCKRTGIRCALLNATKSINNEQKLLTPNKSSSAHIVVCTPGRFVDHLDASTDWKLHHLRFLVIDEADRMMDLLKHSWLNKLNHHLTSKGRAWHKETTTISACSLVDGEKLMPLQKLLFSATLSADPEKLQQLDLYFPQLFTAVTCSNIKQQQQKKKEEGEDGDKEQQQLAFIGKYTTPVGLKESMLICTIGDKLYNALHLILKFDRSICFAKKIDDAKKLALFVNNYLKASGNEMKCSEFSSAMSQKQRVHTMKKFKNKKINCLICSDCAARGLDMLDVPQVILYDVPTQIKTYIHRIGRTARAGKHGHAYTLLIKEEAYNFKKMIKDAGKEKPKKLKKLSEEEMRTYTTALQGST